MKFEEKLRALIEKKYGKLNYSKLAREIGETPQKVRAWAVGDHEPRSDAMIKIAEYFNVDPRSLVDETAGPSAKPVFDYVTASARREQSSAYAALCTAVASMQKKGVIPETDILADFGDIFASVDFANKLGVVTVVIADARETRDQFISRAKDPILDLAMIKRRDAERECLRDYNVVVVPSEFSTKENIDPFSELSFDINTVFKSLKHISDAFYINLSLCDDELDAILAVYETISSDNASSRKRRINEAIDRSEDDNNGSSNVA